MFDPGRCIAASPALADALREVSPGHPRELLSYLVCNERIEFEPIDQSRIGTNPAWVQDPELPSCRRCGTRMALIVQLPGDVVHPRAFHRGTFFLFGCRKHPEETKTVAQYT